MPCTKTISFTYESNYHVHSYWPHITTVTAHYIFCDLWAYDYFNLFHAKGSQSVCVFIYPAHSLRDLIYCKKKSHTSRQVIVLYKWQMFVTSWFHCLIIKLNFQCFCELFHHCTKKWVSTNEIHVVQVILIIIFVHNAIKLFLICWIIIMTSFFFLLILSFSSPYSLY